jgi:hypothetical protein
LSLDIGVESAIIESEVGGDMNNPLRKLTKHTGTTVDSKGTEFNYTCLTTKEYTFDKDANGSWKRETIYIDDIFNQQAKTLKELKELMSKK